MPTIHLLPPSIRLSVLTGLAALALSVAPTALARDVAGINVPEQITVANVPLQLNGAGVRYKAVFKVYTAALYVPRKTSSADEAMATNSPKRMSVTMLREIDSAELGKLFIRGMEDNMDRAATARLVPGIMRMSQVFSDHKRLKEGEGFQVDWIPGTGAVVSIKGQVVSEPFREPEFFQAIMRIWLGAKPADWTLKDALLGKAKEPS